MHSFLLPTTAALLALAPCLAGQSSRPASEPARDERVSVTLKNGETLTGVALRGIKNERLVQGRFEPATDATLPKTGVRLYYYRDLDGYLFLEHKNVARLDVLDTLTREQSQELADAMRKAREGRDLARKAAAAARARPESRPAPEEGDEPGPPERSAAPEPLSEDDRAILEKFPPSEGWSPETFGELKRRSIVLHVYPTAREQEFLDAFPSWRAAWTKQAALDAAKETKGGPEGEPAPPTK